MLCYIQDLLAWVKKKQQLVKNSEWKADLLSTEFHLGSYHSLHQSIFDFKFNIYHAQEDEVITHYPIVNYFSVTDTFKVFYLLPFITFFKKSKCLKYYLYVVSTESVNQYQ